MNLSSAFAEGILNSPLLQNRDLSPFISPFPTYPRRFSQDLAELVQFNLEQSPFQAPDPDLPCPEAQDNAEESPFEQDGDMPMPIPDRQDQLTPVQSPYQAPKEELPSTKLQELSSESEPPELQLSLGSQQLTPIETLINYLIVHSKLSEERITSESFRLFPASETLREIFQLLAKKFRKLRKTKEEMVKYCIRKAFKYVTQLTKKSSKTRDLDISMRQYFAQDGGCSFSIPFKKNSMQKTMNGCFLRRIFACPRFTNDYQRFVKDFQKLMIQDNRRKVAYLAQLIHQAVAQGTPEKVEKIKRLPWTIQILDETNQLALGLAQTKGEGIGRRKR